MQRETMWRSSAAGSTTLEVFSVLLESFQMTSTSERNDSACAIRLLAAQSSVMPTYSVAHRRDTTFSAFLTS